MIAGNEARQLMVMSSASILSSGHRGVDVDASQLFATESNGIQHHAQCMMSNLNWWRAKQS